MSGGVLMRLQRVGLTAATFILFLVTSSAEAAILAADDFSGPGSGTGWAAGNNWEGLAGGMISTADVASFRDFAAPIDGTNQVTYIRFDFTQSVPGTGAQWGGASLFEGVEGAEATETFFAGDPGQTPNQYGLDLHNDAVNGAPPGDALFSGIAINNQPHTIIAAIDTTPAGASTTYQLWVDNFNAGAPTASITVNGPIDAPWRTFRMNSDASNTDFFDNLTIATTAREVGLVPEPASLGLFGLFVVMLLGINGRRR
jgi:hypothetical protein